MAYESLERIGKQPGGARPQDFRPFGKDVAPGVQLNTVQHLLASWRTGPAADAAPAHEPAIGTLRVLHGYTAVWSDLSRTRNGGELSLTATSPNVPRPAETWNLRGTGANELVAEVPQESRARVKVGGLVGLLRDGSELWVGMIRRLQARTDGGLNAEIAVLSRVPEARTLRQVFEKGEDRPYTEAASKQFGMSSMRVLILSAEPGKPVNLLLPTERWAPGRAFELEKNSELHYLRGAQVVRRGEDYVLATFEWVPAPD
jgi:hypothetical protein